MPDVRSGLFENDRLDEDDRLIAKLTKNLQSADLKRKLSFDGNDPTVHRGPNLSERWFISTEQNISNGFFFWVNPSECQWRIATRTSIEQIQGGAVHHEWRTTGVGTQRAGTKFDMPVVSFTFQSGIITPNGYNDTQSRIATVPTTGASWETKLTPEGGKNAKLPPGLGNFYDFIDILDAPNQTTDGQPNYVNILCHSAILPEIWLSGFFSQEGVQWSDSADSPNQITSWGASFVVFATKPELTSTALRGAFQKVGFKT